MATPKQVSFVRGLLHKLGLDDEETKNGMALQYSNNRTIHLTDLHHPEVSALINFLKKEADVPDTPAQKMRGKILSMAHEMRWELPGGKVDMDRLNAWCVKYSQKHKPLDDYYDYELPVVVSQFEKMYNDYLKGL